MAIESVDAGESDCSNPTDHLQRVARDSSIVFSAAAALVGSSTADPGVGESLVFDGMQFVWVPEGRFTMCSGVSSESLGLELTRVQTSGGSRLGKYDATQSEWHGSHLSCARLRALESVTVYAQAPREGPFPWRQIVPAN